MWRALLGAAVAATTLITTGVAYGAEPGEYAPVDRSGPSLTVPARKLDDSLACHGDVKGSSRKPVLMLHGGGAGPDSSRWNAQKWFAQRGTPYCVLSIPIFGNEDLQISAEYVVNAIRTVHGLRDGKINLFSQSLGGPVGRWALRFWPDTRAMIDDYVEVVPPNHGTGPSTEALCVASVVSRVKPLTSCLAGGWQIKPGSRWLEALNSRQETFDGISSTVVYSKFDEIVVGPALRDDGGEVRNVATQDICPLDVSDHLLAATSSPITYALTFDALDHPGPADPARINRNVCRELLAPGIDPVAFPVDFGKAPIELGRIILFGGPPSNVTPSEPPLRCYVYADCDSSN
jgi:pimeloyl-ACP methyl ester carboxylesterase